jgi:hypothetical protein
MTTPTPGIPNFEAGYGPQKTDMQSLWVNPLAFFQQRTVFRATQSTTTTTLPSSGAITTIGFDTIIEDPYGGWNATNHWWLAPFSGWYQVTLTVWVASAGATEVVLQPNIQCTGAAGNLAQGVALAAVPLPSAAPGAAECTWYPFMVGGLDYVYGAASIQNSSSSIATDNTSGDQPSMEIIWIMG